MYHSVVAHLQPLEYLYVLDVKASEVLECLYDRGLRRWRWRIIPLCHIQGVVLDVYLKTAIGRNRTVRKDAKEKAQLQDDCGES